MAVNKRKILASAQKHLQKGALDKALRDYQTVLEADPRDSNVRLKVGDLLLRQGQRSEAFSTYLKVADQFMREGFDAKAVALYKQIAKIDPTRYDIYLPLADLYQRLGLVSEAMNALQTAADHYHREGRKGEALDLLRRMAGLDPSNTISRLKIADLLRQAGRDDEALTEYEETAAELERQGDWEAQVGVLERVLELEPKRAETLTNLCRVLVDQGQATRAESFARRLLDADPGAPEGYELLASVYGQLGREQDATAVYRQLAEIYRTRGDEDRARDIAQRFLPAEPLDLGSLAESGDESLQLDLDDEATDGPTLETDEPQIELGGESAPTAEPPAPDEGFLEESGDRIELDAEEETSPDQLLAEAAVYLRYGKHDRAIVSLERVLAAEPDHPIALDRLAEAHAHAGSPARAIDAFVQAAEHARERGDRTRFETLHARVAELDPKRAQVLAPDAAAPQAPPDPEPEIEDLEVQAPSLEMEETEPGEPAGAESDLGDIEIEVDTGDLELEGEGAGPAPAEASGEKSKGSGTMPEQIVGDLEEAQFYFDQGMFDEAEGIYRRVLAAAPSHPQALLRLGEIAAARGEDPGDTGATASEGAGVDIEATFPEDASLDTDSEPALEEPARAQDVETQTLEESEADSGEIDEIFDDEEITIDDGDEPLLDDEPPGQALFDLAAELNDVLGEETAPHETGSVATDEDGFQAIFRDFKRGVSETLGEGDRETRYDLGIAYREMGLFDDAIGEFQIAAELPDRRFDALHMLGLCHLESGRASDAAASLEQALSVGDVPEERQAAVRFDLARAYQDFGDRERALATFRQVAEIDPDFQGVSDRIAALEEAEPTGAISGEGFESFDDLLAETDEEPASAPESYESFDDLMAEVEEVEAEELEAEELEAEEEAPASSEPPKRRRKISFV